MIKNPFKPRTFATWNQPGRVRQIFRHERGARLQCESGWIDLMLIAPDVLRVSWRLEDSTAPLPLQTIRDAQWLPVEDQFTDGDEWLELATGALAIRVNKRQFRLRIELLPDRRVVCQDAAGIGWRENGELSLSMALTPEEVSCGLGARASRLNLRGKRYRLWNSDPGAVKRDIDPLPFSYPFYLGVRENAAYGVLWDNAQRGSVDLTGNELIFEAERGELSYVLFAGADANAVTRRFLELLGGVELPPMWALGYGQWALPEFAPKIIERRIPTQFAYLSPTGDLTSLRQIIPHLRSAGIKVIVTLTPAVPITGGVPAIKAADGSTFSANGASVLPDFTDIAAQVWWSDKLAALIDMGVDGFTLENAEPIAVNATGKAAPLPDDLVH
ncbi:MAG: hypothetical protein IAE80_00030, partial [Anaerolinea sp.]|nr:hypothetical protein [Anaerolinea sp.]